MQWLKQLLARRPSLPAPALVNGFPAPWNLDRPSIHGHLADFALEAGGRLPDAALPLPDEALIASRSGSTLRWAPGAFDGAFGHHASPSDGLSADQALRALASASTTRSPEHVKDFYDLVNDDRVLSLVDPLLEAVQQSDSLDADAVRLFARWLMCEAPDRSPVKVGIALLGLIQPQQDTAPLMRLGLHDEFTLYVAVALSNSLPTDEAEKALWTLARSVDGWGRIHLVERLSRTGRADLKAWLLRDGYKNSIMVEYLAHPCANGGNLLAALQADTVDDALLHGAGEILQALIAGGPVADIGAYDDGVEAVQRFLTHVAGRTSPPLTIYLAVSAIADFVVDADPAREDLAAQGWLPERRAAIGAKAAEILAAPRWQALTMTSLDAEDGETFWTAATVAEHLGLDIWDTRLERQRLGKGPQWFWLMRSTDPTRIDRALALALIQIDLASIATGPGNETGLGPAFAQHSALDWILQELGRFPGNGETFIAAGLRSPVIRNRSMAVRALQAWERSAWPPEALAQLTQAHRDEPAADLRERMGALLV
ncbi:hypothetical protein [Roseateles noduli]|uniref:hypothetical protein n=1 Tax=Roseateles noduli TaxID=2052484 RepID=UPI003D64CC32